MRIISGSLRGEKIKAPTNLAVRPTTDFAKEGLFNILNNHYYFDEISVLDLFFGIGSITLEFASRGSANIVSVDQNPGSYKFLSETAEQLGFDGKITVQREDVYKFLTNNRFGRFDVVFADPPFDFEQELYEKLITLVKENDWLEEEGSLILEHPREINLEDNEYFIETRKYGHVHFSFFEFGE